MNPYPNKLLQIREVGLRDGLQMVSSYPAHAQKLAVIDAAYAAGIRHFEVGSFLPRETFPQFADVEPLIEHVATLPGARSGALALNFRGAERALDTQIDEIVCVVSASEAHNLRNAKRSREDTLKEIERVLKARPSEGPLVMVAIAMSFGCSISGKESVQVSEVVEIAKRCAGAGADIISVADTVGYAGPGEVRRLVRALRAGIARTPLACHFHDTRGMGIANAAAALDELVYILDSSLGGLGGCPFAPAATGNIVTEDLAFLGKTLGIAPDLDIVALVAARELLAASMPSEAFHGQLAKAGVPHSVDATAAVSPSPWQCIP